MEGKTRWPIAPEIRDRLAARHKGQTAKIGFLGLNLAIHEPARLGIMSLLASEPLLLVSIRQQLKMSDGNARRHLARLVSVGYVQTFGDYYRLTDEGMNALLDYLASMNRVIESVAMAVCRRGLDVTLKPSKARGGENPGSGSGRGAD